MKLRSQNFTILFWQSDSERKKAGFLQGLIKGDQLREESAKLQMFGDTVIAKYLSIPSHRKRELTRETKKLGRRVGVASSGDTKLLHVFEVFLVYYHFTIFTVHICVFNKSLLKLTSTSLLLQTFVFGLFFCNSLTVKG